jgi:hypothetical protein
MCEITFGHEVVGLEHVLDIGAMDADRDVVIMCWGRLAMRPLMRRVGASWRWRTCVTKRLDCAMVTCMLTLRT